MSEDTQAADAATAAFFSRNNLPAVSHERAVELAKTFRLMKASDDMLRLLESGWLLDELLTGQLRGSAQIAANTQVYRPPAPTVTEAVSRRAGAAMAGLKRFNLDSHGEGAIFSASLSVIAYGNWQGSPTAADRAIAGAEALVKRREAELAPSGSGRRR